MCTVYGIIRVGGDDMINYKTKNGKFQTQYVSENSLNIIIHIIVLFVRSLNIIDPISEERKLRYFDETIKNIKGSCIVIMLTF